MKGYNRLACSLVLLLSMFPFVLADHGVESEGYGLSDPVLYLKIVAVFVVVFTVFMLSLGRGLSMKYKKTFFFTLIIPIVFASVYLAGYTIVVNLDSVTGGPVHWHADYQVHICGDELDLVDPKFPANKIGTPLLHEHNDHRLHVEGTVNELSDASLGSYFSTVGGSLTESSFGYLTESGLVEVKNGDDCAGSLGELKVFVNGQRIDDPASYILYPYPNVPFGDCIIFLFDASNADTTELICDSWAASEVTYDSYKRPEVTIGSKKWQ